VTIRLSIAALIDARRPELLLGGSFCRLHDLTPNYTVMWQINVETELRSASLCLILLIRTSLSISNEMSIDKQTIFSP
jgi:hypothetical protein